MKPTKPNPLGLLAGALAGGNPSDLIESSERAGGQEILHGDSLPTEILRGSESEFTGLGFVLGEPYPDDPIFRPATLPEGWSKKDGEHQYGYWNYIVDETGRERVAIFYKAAFYDRHAHMELIKEDG